MTLEKFFSPSSVAVVGASPRKGNLGRSILEKMLDSFSGHLYPVNPSMKPILGLKTFKDLRSIPEIPELVVIVVPSQIVKTIVEEASNLNIPAIIIISAGFRESGYPERERELLQLKKQSRILGPNCLGIVDCHSGVNTLFPTNPLPKAGNVSLVLQSGAFGIDVIVKFYLEEVSLSKYISYGNAIDIQETELLELLGRDPSTEVIGLYLEGILDPDFRTITNMVARKKPIVGIVAGGGIVSKATQSHTGTLATDMKIYEGAFKQIGIHKVKTTTEFIDAIKALSKQPVPPESTIAIVSNVGGPAMCALMHCRRLGINIAPIQDHVRLEANAYLKGRNLHSKVLQDQQSMGFGFVDATGSATEKDLCTIMDYFLQEKSVGGGLLLARTDAPSINIEIIEEVNSLTKKHNTKPLLVYDLPRNPAFSLYDPIGVPVYPAPERAVDGMFALISRGKYNQRNQFE